MSGNITDAIREAMKEISMEERKGILNDIYGAVDDLVDELGLSATEQEPPRYRVEIQDPPGMWRKVVYDTQKLREGWTITVSKLSGGLWTPITSCAVDED